MSAQNDFISGFDLSSVSSASQAQVMQAINGLAPLTNVGGIIVMSGAAAAVPDVANNARFARYLWIDTQTAPYTLKTYNGSAWVTSTIGTGALNTLTQITDGLITIAKLSTAGSASGDLIRVAPSAPTTYELLEIIKFP